MTQELLLGWPLVDNTPRSDEPVYGTSENPHDLSPLSRDIQVGILQEPELPRMFSDHHSPYTNAHAMPGNRTLTTLSKGSDCHKSPLSLIPRSTLKQMLTFDTCFLHHEDENVTSRIYICKNRTVSVNYTFKTTSFLNQRIDENHDTTHRYTLCAQKTTPVHTMWTPYGDVIALKRPEISISERVRISPFYKRLNRLRARNPNVTANLGNLWNEFGAIRGNNESYSLPARAACKAPTRIRFTANGCTDAHHPVTSMQVSCPGRRGPHPLSGNKNACLENLD